VAAARGLAKVETAYFSLILVGKDPSFAGRGGGVAELRQHYTTGHE